MFGRLGGFVARNYLWVILAWLVLLVTLRVAAPRWNDITHDGDLAYLPKEMTSVAGERLLSEAFPLDLAKSQIVVIIASKHGRLEDDNLFVAYDVARRMKNLQGAAGMTLAEQLAVRAEQTKDPASSLAMAERSEQRWEEAVEAFDDAIALNESMIAQFETDAALVQPLAEPYWNRAIWNRKRNEAAAAEEDRLVALSLDPKLSGESALPEQAGSLPLLDVWTWKDRVFGDTLVAPDKGARLVVLRLSNEFLATDNIRVLEMVEAELEKARRTAKQRGLDDVTIAISGSAAVGGDLLRSSAESIRHTELFTVLLVILILGVVYRSPLLVAAPLLTIGVALLTSTAIIALLAQSGGALDQWWGFKVFTTTRIFIVVILFGAGTDYCLFLIARYKEELVNCDSSEEAVSRALSGVGEALAASALTTILGLATMAFSEFGKYRYSGPIIGLCLFVTLLTCLTLTPALLRLLGPWVFWPFSAPKRVALSRAQKPPGWAGSFWEQTARIIVAYPGRIFALTVLVMTPMAVYGVGWGNQVTYDVLNSLSSACPSKRGSLLLREHFPIGQSGPVTILAYRSEGELNSDEGKQRIAELSQQLYLADAGGGVASVRSLADPLGDFQPGERTGLFANQAWRKRAASPHRRTAALFLAQAPHLIGRVARFDVLLDVDPFAIEAIDSLARVDRKLTALQEDPDSFWHGATFYFTGTTAGIRDLRAVTRADNVRIEIYVVLAVLAVLLLILRRPLVCLYMIATVLFSYYVTLGASTLFFSWVYGASFEGLDWKAPLYLFVILVAVGQDYNVYLATRIIEEQDRLGPFAGLRRAIVSTGGIITSCGVIMAGTFASMTSGAWGSSITAWIPGAQSGDVGALRGIVELGFALALGVLLDTFVVRPILVPAFFALLDRRRARQAAMVVPAGIGTQTSSK